MQGGIAVGGISNPHRHRLDHDKPGELFADGQTRVADLTDEICLIGKQPDDLFLAQAKFTQPILNIRGRGEPLDADSHSGADGIQRTNFTIRFARGAGFKFAIHLV